MPGPEASGDRQIAGGRVQHHLDSRKAPGEVQHCSYDRDRHQKGVRKEKPHHDVAEADAEDPAHRRHGTQPTRRFPAFLGHKRIIVFAHDPGQQ